MTVREPIEYDDAPPVRSASIAASICASRLAADAMPRSLRDGVVCQQYGHGVALLWRVNCNSKLQQEAMI